MNEGENITGENSKKNLNHIVNDIERECLNSRINQKAYVSIFNTSRHLKISNTSVTFLVLYSMH